MRNLTSKKYIRGYIYTIGRQYAFLNQSQSVEDAKPIRKKKEEL